jgi:signal transduction histidine kinase
VQPLVDDLNMLLDERDETIKRAIARAADLAHGLKTPLAVLAHEGERADASGQHDIARSIHDEVNRMRRQVDYELAQARAVASGLASPERVVVLDSVNGLVRALQRLHADRHLTFDVRVDAAHCVRGQAVDVDEMFGNLLDNACRWARSRIAVIAVHDEGHVIIAIEDDGPGLDAAMRDAVLRRGVRADQSGPGSGLGLAIVRDLARLYGGTIVLTPSTMGGLRAELRLPA